MDRRTRETLLNADLLSCLDTPLNSPREVYNVITIELGGYLLQIGKNAYSNESMVDTHRARHPKCLWFHALGAGGSHVILCLEGKALPPDDVIRAAGKLALEYSRSRGITVRMARLEQLDKPLEAGPGVWHARHFAVCEVA